MIDQGDFVTQHLLSSRGSGRWQFWDAAVDNGARRRSGETAPLVRVLVGGERFDRPVRQGRSPLYLEVLGELGVGFVLVLALVGFGVSVGTSARSALRATSGYRSPR